LTDPDARISGKRSAHLRDAYLALREHRFPLRNPILLTKEGCEYMSKFPLAIEVIE
jgi:hypothetical protein